MNPRNLPQKILKPSPIPVKKVKEKVPDEFWCEHCEYDIRTKNEQRYKCESKVCKAVKGYIEYDPCGQCVKYCDVCGSTLCKECVYQCKDLDCDVENIECEDCVLRCHCEAHSCKGLIYLSGYELDNPYACQDCYNEYILG